MKEDNNRGTTVLLTVIGIATLLVAVVGATFAYFTANVNETNSKKDVTVKAATIGNVVFEHSNAISLDRAFPGDSHSLTFQVEADSNSTMTLHYKVLLHVIKNDFEASKVDGNTENLNLQYDLSMSSKNGSEGATPSVAFTSKTDEKMNATTFAEGQTVEIGSGTLGTLGTIDEWTLNLKLVETGQEQNNDQDKHFNAKIEVVSDGDYITSNENGKGSQVVSEQPSAS